MAVFFGMPDDDCKATLAQAMREWHPALTKLGVRVQIIMAASDSDTPAVKHGGYAALATIRVVPLKDRLTKQYDAEALVSRHDWENLSEEQRLALFDHLLSRVDPVKKEKKQRRGYKGPKQYYTPLDDLGRPKLKLRLGDWSAGDGFAAVVQRHGDNAIEFENLRRAYAFAERAKSGEWQPEDQGGEIVETVDRNDIDTQLTFDDVYQELTEAVADLADKGVTVTFRPGEIRQEPAAPEPAPAFEVGGPRETNVPVRETEQAARETTPVPTWRKMPLSETGWEAGIESETWAKITIACWTAGELADELLKGETFGTTAEYLANLYAFVEQISQDDDTPIRFDRPDWTAPVPETKEADTQDAGLIRAIHGFADADKRWAKLQESGATDAVIRAALTFEMGSSGGSAGPGVEAVARKGGSNPAFWYGKVTPVGKPTLTGKPLIDAVRRVMGIPQPVADVKPSAEPPATKLADLDNFPDAAFDACFAKGVSTLETLMDRHHNWAESEPVEMIESPLRKQLVAFFRADFGMKLKVAEHAADAVAGHVAHSGRAAAIVAEAKSARFTVEQSNEPFDPEIPDQFAWLVVDTTKDAKGKPSVRYIDEYRSEAEAHAAASRYEEAAKKAEAEPKPAKKGKGKAEPEPTSAKAALKAARAAGKTTFTHTTKPAGKKPKAVAK